MGTQKMYSLIDKTQYGSTFGIRGKNEYDCEHLTDKGIVYSLTDKTEPYTLFSFGIPSKDVKYPKILEDIRFPLPKRVGVVSGDIKSNGNWEIEVYQFEEDCLFYAGTARESIFVPWYNRDYGQKLLNPRYRYISDGVSLVGHPFELTEEQFGLFKRLTSRDEIIRLRF